MAESDLIPLFPLHTVLFPGAVLPLHVFEERYRLLVQEGRDFGVVLIRHGSEVGQGRATELYAVGTVAALVRVEVLAGGRFAILARGLSRFRILEVDEQGRPYSVARVARLPEPEVQAPPRLVALVERYLVSRGLQVHPQLAPDLQGRAVWLAGSVLEAEQPKRQQLLETGDPALAEELLAAELAKRETIGRLGTLPPRRPSPN